MAKQRRGPSSMAPARARVVKATSAGEPQPKRLRQDFPKLNLRRLVSKRTIRTLRKPLVTDGVMGGVETITRDAAGNSIPNGVVTPGAGGYKGAVAVFKDQKKTTSPAKGTKVVRTPNPAPGGIRNPFRGKGL